MESTRSQRMSYPIFVVDAFTSQPFGGNPAAVVLGRGDFEAEWMQLVAAEMKHSETAFVTEREPGDYDLRWFTPEVEVDLCGHATLASAHVLFSTDRLAADRTAVFHTRGGDLRATHSGDDGITLDFPIAEPQPEPPNDRLFDALGIDPRDFLRTDGDFFMCVVDDWKTVAEVEARLHETSCAQRRARRLRHRRGRPRATRHRLTVFRTPCRHRRRRRHGLDALRSRRLLVPSPRHRCAACVPGIRARRISSS